MVASNHTDLAIIIVLIADFPSKRVILIFTLNAQTGLLPSLNNCHYAILTSILSCLMALLAQSSGFSAPST